MTHDVFTFLVHHTGGRRKEWVDDDVDLDVFSHRAEAYSGAGVVVVCRDAAMMPVRRVVKGALEKGLSGPEIQQHVVAMKDELAAAVTRHDFRC